MGNDETVKVQGEPIQTEPNAGLVSAEQWFQLHAQLAGFTPQQTAFLYAVVMRGDARRELAMLTNQKRLENQIR